MGSGFRDISPVVGIQEEGHMESDMELAGIYQDGGFSNYCPVILTVLMRRS